MTTVENPFLLGCPFCGETPVLVLPGKIECTNETCPAKPKVEAISPRDAALLWNRRLR